MISNEIILQIYFWSSHSNVALHHLTTSYTLGFFCAFNLKIYLEFSKLVISVCSKLMMKLTIVKSEVTESVLTVWRRR